MQERQDRQAMRLDILRNGLAHREEDGRVTLIRPDRNGRQYVQVEVAREIADKFTLVNGDVVEGLTEPIESEVEFTPGSNAEYEDLSEYDERDEPAAVRGERVPDWLLTRITPTERLRQVESINGLPQEEALARPSPRQRRSSLERIVPDRLVPLSTGPADTTGRLLDFAAPFGLGYAGILYGPHGSGLSRGLQTVVRGVLTNAPDCQVFVLLLRPRSEEITDWRRRFPQAEVVACPSPQNGATPEQMLLVADLVLESAKRQTELGLPVLLAVDSLTGLWGAMLESEEADAQTQADRAWSRHRIREWLQTAGNFSTEGLLGGGLGGSLTLVGTVWHQGVDTEAEEEGEVHPHLRLLEHLLHETQWRVPLSGAFARERIFPAIDPARCLSLREENLLPPAQYEPLLAARSLLADLTPRTRLLRLLDSLDESEDSTSLLQHLQNTR